ncbi:MAG: hypothetical protein CMJ89_19440 [Planctomycetes bacterium]|nr:hypothetical protein [Planctomycetota bacterium]
MITQDLVQVFDMLSEPAARMATAPMLALAVGVALYLLCEVIDLLRTARPIVFLGSIALSIFYELRILQADSAPGAVFDGTFIADGQTALWGILFLVGTLLVWAYSVGYYRENLPFKAEYDALILCTPVGMMLMVGANDLIVFFVGLELLSMPLYALAAFRRAKIESVEAGLKYFLLGSFSSALFLYGAALLYANGGTLALDALVAESNLATTGVALVAASLFFKVSVFPFHLWVPDVYQGSPTPITALMATGAKAGAFSFLIVRLTPLLPPAAAQTVAVIALVTMALGNLGALVQRDLKRMLAYSGIAHAGTLLLVVAAGVALGDTSGGEQAAWYYMGAYLFTATGAFGLISLLEADGARFTNLDALRGLAHSRPGIAAALSLFMLSLGGIPATGGFLGKWFVFAELVRADMIGVAVLGALFTVVALGYYLRVIAYLWMEPPPEGAALSNTQRPLTAGLATVFCCLGVLAMGLLPALFLDRMN